MKGDTPYFLTRVSRRQIEAPCHDAKRSGAGLPEATVHDDDAAGLQKFGRRVRIQRIITFYARTRQKEPMALVPTDEALGHEDSPSS